MANHERYLFELMRLQFIRENLELRSVDVEVFIGDKSIQWYFECLVNDDILLSYAAYRVLEIITLHFDKRDIFYQACKGYLNATAICQLEFILKICTKNYEANRDKASVEFIHHLLDHYLNRREIVLLHANEIIRFETQLLLHADANIQNKIKSNLASICIFDCSHSFDASNWCLILKLYSLVVESLSKDDQNNVLNQAMELIIKYQNKNPGLVLNAALLLTTLVRLLMENQNTICLQNSSNLQKIFEKLNSTTVVDCRNALINVLSDDDDVLFSVLSDLLLVHENYDNTTINWSQSDDANERISSTIKSIIQPVEIFHVILNTVFAYDASFVVDMLLQDTSNAFLKYLLRILHYLINNFTTCYDTFNDQIESLYELLVRLKMSLSSEHFPYNPKPLIKLLQQMETNIEQHTQS